MTDTSGTEFWRNMKPIPDPLKPGVPPEIYRSRITDGDERLFVPLSETVFTKPV